MIYQSEYTENREHQSAFLQLHVRTISDDEKIILDSPLTTKELFEAIGDVNNGKDPGPDGLPIEFYKAFQKQLVKPLLDV